MRVWSVAFSFPPQRKSWLLNYFPRSGGRLGGAAPPTTWRAERSEAQTSSIYMGETFFREPGFIPRFHTRSHVFFIHLLKIVRFHTRFHSTSRLFGFIPGFIPGFRPASNKDRFGTRFHTGFIPVVWWAGFIPGFIPVSYRFHRYETRARFHTP